MRAGLRRTGSVAVLLLTLTARGAAEGALDVPFVRQDIHGCGSASAAMVMQYWIARGGEASPEAADADAIQRALYTAGSQGISGLKLRDYLEANGFSAWVIEAREEDLHRHLAKGRPLIVCLRMSRSALHYVVVTGTDEAKRRVVVHDPARGPSLGYSLTKFDRMWEKTGRWALLAVPKAVHQPL